MMESDGEPPALPPWLCGALASSISSSLGECQPACQIYLAGCSQRQVVAWAGKQMTLIRVLRPLDCQAGKLWSAPPSPGNGQVLLWMGAPRHDPPSSPVPHRALPTRKLALAADQLWNSLPLEIHQSPMLPTFGKGLKLFSTGVLLLLFLHSCFKL